MARSRSLFVVAGLALSCGMAFGQHSDNFDSYPSNASIDGLGGWKGWDNIAANAAFTSTDQALSAPNSIIVKGNAATETDYTDNVHEYALTSGKWAYTVHVYVPTGVIEDSYFILLNRYIDGTHVAGDWSVEVQFNATSNLVIDDFANAVTLPHTRTGAALSLVRDRWVEVVATFDLDNNTVEITYDGQQLSSGTWTTAAGSQLAMQAVDLFSFHVPRDQGVYMDDVSLVAVDSGCAADFNGDNQADFFDYLDFAQAFNDEDPSADFNGDNQVDFFDYLDFAQAFDEGC